MKATLVQAVNSALKLEMRKNSDVVLLGEDIGINGGVFRATEGLYDEFGPHRVIDTPLAESGIIGLAIGMSLYGLRPVAEIQFFDFIFSGFDQITSELAKMRYRSGGTYSARVAPGGSVFWTVSKSGPYTVRVFPFEPYRDLMREKRQAIQTLLTSKTLTAAERRELLRQVRLDQMELDLDSVYVLGGGTACSGAIPEIADFVEDDFVNIFVTLSYDQAAVRWKAGCG